MENIIRSDLQILRELAKQQYELSQTPQMQTLKKEWFLHNTFKGTRPMITIELGGFESEIIPPLLKCEGEKAREIEARLYRNMVNHTLFGDDFVVKDYYPITHSVWLKLFDLNVERVETGGLGHQFVHQITDLKEDFYKIEQNSKYFGDKSKTQKEIEFINELFGDILPAKLEGRGLYAVPTQDVVHFMGMENMLFAMYDYPAEFKAMMDRIADEYIEYFNWLAADGFLLPTVGGEAVAQGTWCYTDELPSEKPELTTCDVWGFLDSQETVNISPDMFGEFVWPCYEKIARNYGLLSYGCCEPVHPIFDDYLSTLPNLRKVSISPWCDEEFMGERLKGKNIIFHRKPSPNFIGVGIELDEAAVIEHIDKTVKAAKGCKLEFTQRDVYTAANNPEKVRRFVELIRQRAEK